MSILLAGSSQSGARELDSGKAVFSSQRIGYLASALRFAPILMLFLIPHYALADCNVVTGNETAGCIAVTAGQPLTIQSGATLNGRISMTGTGATLNVANGGTFQYLLNAPGGGTIAVGMTAPNQTLTNNGTIGVTVANTAVDVIAARATGFTIVNGPTGVIASNNANPFANAITNFDAGVSGTVINMGTISSTGGASEGTIYMPGAGGVFTLDNRPGATIRGDTAIAVNVTGTKQTVLRNAGTISTGVVGGTAISLGSGSDSVTLEPTSSITGIVNGQAGVDTLSLGGAATNGNFNIGLIGPAGQYRNFELFRKIEPGTWTLNGSAATATSWTVTGGTLRLGSSSLGLTSLTAAGGDISYNDGVVNASPVILNSAARLIVDGTDHATQTGIISGSGTATKDGAGTLILTGANSYTGGTQITAGTLQLGAGGLTGSIIGNVLNNGTLAFNRADAINFPGIISGNGSVAQIGSGTTTLTGLNTYAGGTVINAGTLSVGQDANLGAANDGLIFNGGTLHNTATMTMNRPVVFNGLGTIDTAPGTVLSNAGGSSGAGHLQKTGTGVLTLTGANTHVGGTTISAGTLQLGNGGTSGSLVGNILDNATLSINRSDALLLPGTISGTGILNQIGTGTTVLTAENTYTSGTTIAAGTLQLGNGGTTGSIAGNVADNGTLAFNRSDEFLFAGVISGTGTVAQIGSGTTTLTGLNTYPGGTVINAGTLSVGQDANLGAANGGLTFNGGILHNTAIMTMNRPVVFNGLGTIDTAPGTVLSNAGNSSGTGSLQKTGGGILALTGANTHTGGTTISAGTLQLGNGGTSGSLVGNILDNATLSINRSDALLLPGTISGAGTLNQIGTGTTVLTAENTYTGGTTISAGTLQLGNGGTSGSLVGNILDNATLSINRYDALLLPGTVSGAGALNQIGTGTTVLTAENTYTGGTTIATGTLQLGNGGTSGSLVGNILDNATLSINRSDTVLLPGTVSGAGTLNQIGTGTTVLTGENTYTGGTTIAAGTLQLGDGGTTGSIVGNVADDGTLAFNRSDEILFAGVISGTGAVSQIGTGTTVLSGANTWSGPTTVSTGTLRAGGTDTFSPNSAFTVSSGVTLDTAGFNQNVAALQNAGTVSLSSATAGHTLTVTGDYVGNSGTLRLGTGLDSGASVSDRLVLNGTTASASGNTTIQLTSLNGLGAPTTGDGIEVVSGINGATSTAQANRSAFNLANGHVDAGAFEYRLYAANAQGSGENWYLRTEVPVTEALAILPEQPQPGEEPPSSGQPSVPIKPSQPVRLVPTYRAEVPLFVALPAQLRQADLEILGNLHQRIGDETSAESSAATSSAEPKTPRAWARAVYSSFDIKQPGVADTQSEGDVSGLQLGTDVWLNGDWRAGVYVGHLDGEADIKGNASGVTAGVGNNTVQSNYLGGYMTWMNADGFYVDNVLQGGDQRYTLRPDSNPNVSGKASSVTASIETGKPFTLGGPWSIEPQAQLIYQHTNVDDEHISGADVHIGADSGWIARLGVRVKGEMAIDVGTLLPYVRLNIYHATFSDDDTTFAGPAAATTISNPGGYSVAEAAAGTTWKLTSSTSLYGEIGHLWDMDGDATVRGPVQGSLGVKARW